MIFTSFRASPSVSNMANISDSLSHNLQNNSLQNATLKRSVSSYISKIHQLSRTNSFSLHTHTHTHTHLPDVVVNVVLVVRLGADGSAASGTWVVCRQWGQVIALPGAGARGARARAGARGGFGGGWRVMLEGVFGAAFAPGARGCKWGVVAASGKTCLPVVVGRARFVGECAARWRRCQARLGAGLTVAHYGRLVTAVHREVLVGTAVYYALLSRRWRGILWVLWSSALDALNSPPEIGEARVERQE